MREGTAEPGVERRILIIDDDTDLCELVTEYLKSEHFKIDTVSSGEEGLELALGGDYSMVILDVMLPGINGFEVLRGIRAESKTPVVMLSARGEDIDRIVGLEIGADDYLSKPFNPRELLARIQAILRRLRTSREGLEKGATLLIGDLRLEKGTRSVYRKDELIDLTAVEFDLLEVLVRSAGQIVAREELFRKVLNREISPLDRSLDMHISKLRRKLGSKTGGVDRIKTVRSTGYMYASLKANGEDEPTKPPG